jgi:hypothetical protein
MPEGEIKPALGLPNERLDSQFFRIVPTNGTNMSARCSIGANHPEER